MRDRTGAPETINGLSCPHCDPVVRAVTYGGPSSSFVRIVDTFENGRVHREIFARGFIHHVNVKVSLG